MSVLSSNKKLSKGYVGTNKKIKKIYFGTKLVWQSEVYYTIKFVNSDGTILQSSQVLAGTVPSYTGSTPTKTSTAQYSYTFKSWDTTPVAAVGNATYTATYNSTLRSYTITWSYKGTDGSDTTSTTTCTYGSTPSAGFTPSAYSITTASTITTYTFSSWSPTIASCTGDTTYTASYSSSSQTRSYTITWSYKDSSGNTTSTTTSCAYGSTPSAGFTPSSYSTTSTTYTFSSWSPSISTCTGATTYTAQYSSATRSYTITWSYKNSSGNDTSTTTSCAYGSTPSAGFTPSSYSTTGTSWTTTYTFSSWSPSISSCTGATTYTATYSSSTTYYTLSAPTTYHDSDSSCDINVSNPNSVAVTCYYGTSSGSTSNSTTISANSSAWVSVGSWNTTYYFFFRASGYNDSSVATGNAGYAPLSAPTTTHDSDSTADISVSNPNSVAVTCYYGTSSGSTSYSTTISANSSTWISNGITWDTTYYFYFAADGYPSSSSTTGTAGSQPTTYYTVSFSTGSGSGSTSYSSISVPSGTSVSASGRYLYIGDYTITATASSGYSFSYWSKTSGTITSDQTIYAYYAADTVYYTVYFSAGTGGSVSRSSVSVESGSSISASGSTLYVGSYTITATTSSGYDFSYWSKTSGSITSSQTIYAYFEEKATATKLSAPTVAIYDSTYKTNVLRVTVSNPNSTPVTCYYAKGSSSSTATLGSTKAIAANSSTTITLANYSATHVFLFGASGYTNSDATTYVTPSSTPSYLTLGLTRISSYKWTVYMTNPNSFSVDITYSNTKSNASTWSSSSGTHANTSTTTLSGNSYQYVYMADVSMYNDVEGGAYFKYDGYYWCTWLKCTDTSSSISSPSTTTGTWYSSSV